MASSKPSKELSSFYTFPGNYQSLQSIKTKEYTQKEEDAGPEKRRSNTGEWQVKIPDMAVDKNNRIRCVQQAWAGDRPTWSRRTGLQGRTLKAAVRFELPGKCYWWARDNNKGHLAHVAMHRGDLFLQHSGFTSTIAQSWNFRAGRCLAHHTVQIFYSWGFTVENPENLQVLAHYPVMQWLQCHTT